MKKPAVLAALVLCSLPALAQAYPGANAPAASATKPDGYSYTFSDDPLAAGGLTAVDATIRVRPGAIRSVLTRPRTSFVVPMLRSVENL